MGQTRKVYAYFYASKLEIFSGKGTNELKKERKRGITEVYFNCKYIVLFDGRKFHSINC